MENTKTNMTHYLQPLFPKSLLNEPNKNRLQYFKDLVIRHDILNKVEQAILNAMEDDEKNIILVMGPTGIGKTTLCDGTQQKIIKDNQLLIESDPGFIPVIKLEISVPMQGHYSWKSFFLDLLEQIKDPFISTNARKRENKEELFRAVLKGFEHRKVKYIILDEGQHLAEIKGQSKREQLNQLKSLSNKSKNRTIYILFGIYSLMDFDMDGQLTHRTEIIHFHRYRAEIESERQAFQNILRTFYAHIPLSVEIEDPVFEWHYFYTKSAGCTGILKKWLNKAVAEALRTNAGQMSKEILEKTSLTPKQVETIWDEIKLGEKILFNDESILPKLRSEMGIKSKDSNKNPQKRGNPRPGMRKPKRDDIDPAI